MNTESSIDLYPLYIRIARYIEDEIVTGVLKANDRVSSQNELAVMFHVNAATAAKSLSYLINKNVLYKKRGVGMFVKGGAKAIVIEKRRGDLFTRLGNMTAEAKMLGMNRDEIICRMKALLDKE